jgi:succinate dehydrogenase/fumarate reductase flavoprotein subunit
MSPGDVVVVGYGAAGASAAIAAHDAGAGVTVIEKTRAGGGNCRYSGGFLFDVQGPESRAYLDALCFGRTDAGVLDAYLDGLHEIPGWIEQLGGETISIAPPPNMFPPVFPGWPHFPGADGVDHRIFAAGDGLRAGEALWRLLEENVARRGIEVRYATTACELALGDRGLVTGVRFRDADGDGGGDRGGETSTIDAVSVILASGGFEGNDVMKDAYLPLAPMPAVGHAANDGAGVLMVQRAGAALWHMYGFFGWLAFRTPDFPAPFTIDVHGRSHVLVDADGRRFSDELGWEVHDKLRSLTAYSPRRPNHPHLPAYAVFDDAARLAGPLHGIVGTPNDYSWSADNAAEVERGWIVEAAGPRELAGALGLDPAVLAQTLETFNAGARQGRDPLFGRAGDTLAPLETDRLYAIELWPGVATTTGGPRRDARARVLDEAGRPIPGLYAAGGTGSVWGHLIQHGGGLTDAIAFGRIAGREAARRPATPTVIAR